MSPSDKKSQEYKKVAETATQETIEHYRRCRPAILSLSQQGGYKCTLIGDNWDWYKINWDAKKAQLWLANEENYNLLTQKHRTLYGTLQRWAPEIEKEIRSWIKKPTGKWGIDKLKEGSLGTRKDTRLMALSVDIDRAKDKEVTDPNVKRWLEAALKLFADYFKSINFRSYALFFSGGGGYVIVHPLVTTIGEEEGHDIVYRWEMVQQCFDFFISEMEKQFFEQNPEAKEWIKGFDCLNYDAKRQFKMPLSIHLTKPFAVIPLDKENPVIDFEKARLPIADDVIKEAANCLSFYDGDVERLGKHIIEKYANTAKEEIEKSHPLNRTFKAVPDDNELDVDSWAPGARNMYNESKVTGKGTTRRLGFLANYMQFVGVSREKAYNIFQKKANEWTAETSNIFEYWYDGDGEPECWIPNCENFNKEAKGYPHMGFGGMGLCTPDDRCGKIKHPLEYHETPEKRLKKLIERIEKEVSAEINDSYKAVLVDTTVEKDIDKQTGKEKIQIKYHERKEKHILYCVLKSIPQDQVSDNTVFELWSELEPWKKESNRGQLATRFYDYNIITDEKKSEALKKAKVKVDELYRELIPKRKAQQEALSEYFKLIKEIEENKREYNEEERKKALELLKDPLLMPKIKLVLDFKFAGFGKKKLEFFCNLLSKDLDPKRRVSVVIHGKWGEGKSVLTEQVISFFDFERMNSATPQSVYRRAQIDEEYFNNKIVYFGDVGEGASEELKEILDIFKQLISEGEVVRDINLKVGDDYVPVPLKLRGYPILVWTAQTPPSDPQHLSRTMPYNIDVSKEQRERVRTFSSFEEDTPEELRYPPEIKVLEKIIKTALDIIKDDRKPILNPFATLINSCMSIDSSNVNRDRSKFFSLVASITHLHQFQRDTIEFNEKKYLIARPTDVLYALYLAEEDFKILFGSLDAITQRAYNIIKEKRDLISSSLPILKMRTRDTDDKNDKVAALDELEIKAFTNADLEDWLNVSYKTAARTTRNLFKKGLLARDQKGKGYNFYLNNENSKAKTNGNVLFDSQRIKEGLMNETAIGEWLDRTFSPDPQCIDIKNYFLTEDALARLPVPDSKIKIKNTHVYWGERENEESEQPQTFKDLTKNGNYLRDTRRAKEESLNNDVKAEEDAEAKEREKRQPIEIKKILLEVGKCKSCGKDEIDLIYVVHYSNDEFEKVCGACGQQIMKDYGLKLSRGVE